MKKFLLVVMIIFVALYGVSFAEGSYFSTDYNGSIGVGYWMPSITGSVKSDITGSTFNFKDDLGLVNTGTVLADFRYKFDDTSSLYVDYFNLSNKGSQNLPNTFVWRQQQFVAGALVNSVLDVKMVDVIYEKKIYENEQAYLCATIGGKYGHVALGLNNTRASATGLIPEIGLFGKTKMTQNLNGLGRLNVIVGDSGSKRVSMVDLNAGITWDFYQNWAFDAGYKWLQLIDKNSSASNEEFNINYGGPFAMFRYSY